MVLSGEGSDEVFGGYLYFHKAPNKEEFQSETVRKIQVGGSEAGQGGPRGCHED